MITPALDTLSGEVLRNIVYHLLQPPILDVREKAERQPTLLPLFNLAFTCKRLYQVLIQPEDNDAYWKQIMLDSGSGRPCTQPPDFTFDMRVRIIIEPKSNDWSWKTMACRQAQLERTGEDDGVFYGRGVPAPVSRGPLFDYFTWVPQLLGEMLPPFPHPEVHRVLSLEESEKHSVHVNLAALHQKYKHLPTLDEFYGRKTNPRLPNIGTFLTQPPIRELDVYLCFREGVADEMKDKFAEFGIDEISCRQILGAVFPDGPPADPEATLKGTLNSDNPKSRWLPINIKNPNGITTDDFSYIDAWLTGHMPMHPSLMYVMEAITQLQEMMGCPLWRDEWTEHTWCPPTFPPPSEEVNQSDWFLRIVNGGKMIVSLRFDSEEFDRCGSAEYSDDFGGLGSHLDAMEAMMDDWSSNDFSDDGSIEDEDQGVGGGEGDEDAEYSDDGMGG